MDGRRHCCAGRSRHTFRRKRHRTLLLGFRAADGAALRSRLFSYPLHQWRIRLGCPLPHLPQRRHPRGCRRWLRRYHYHDDSALRHSPRPLFQREWYGLGAHRGGRCQDQEPSAPSSCLVDGHVLGHRSDMCSHRPGTREHHPCLSRGGLLRRRRLDEDGLRQDSRHWGSAADLWHRHLRVLNHPRLELLRRARRGIPQW